MEEKTIIEAVATETTTTEKPKKIPPKSSGRPKGSKTTQIHGIPFDEYRALQKQAKVKKLKKVARKRLDLMEKDKPVAMLATPKQKYNIAAIQADFEGKSDSEKLKLTYTELVRRLAVESHQHYFEDIDYENPLSWDKRSKQLVNLKGLLTVTKMMKDLIDSVSVSERGDIIDGEFKQESTDAIKRAEKLLTKFAVVS